MAYEPLHSTESAYAAAQGIDLGLQSFMQSVYRTMGLGLVVTGLVAFGVASSPALMALIFGNKAVSLIVMLAPLGFVLFGFTPARAARLSASQLTFNFSLLSALIGLSLSAIFVVYTGESIARVFFITAATFAGTSLYGYTTKRDLTGFGSFLFMGLLGLVLASVVNLFLHSAMTQFVISVAGVVVFTGLTAWETRNLKDIYRAGAGEANAKAAVLGALSMYLNFLNLFQSLLYLMGNRRS